MIHTHIHNYALPTCSKIKYKGPKKINTLNVYKNSADFNDVQYKQEALHRF